MRGDRQPSEGLRGMRSLSSCAVCRYFKPREKAGLKCINGFMHMNGVRWCPIWAEVTPTSEMINRHYRTSEYGIRCESRLT